MEIRCLGSLVRLLCFERVPTAWFHGCYYAIGKPRLSSWFVRYVMKAHLMGAAFFRSVGGNWEIPFGGAGGSARLASCVKAKRERRSLT